MRSGQIHTAIAHGFTPFQLCHLVSKEVRTAHRHCDRIQDSIGRALQALPQVSCKPTLPPADLAEHPHEPVKALFVPRARINRKARKVPFYWDATGTEFCVVDQKPNGHLSRD